MQTIEWDIKAAYLHADLDETIFAYNPERTELWMLNKSLYGLKQSGNNWMKALFTFLLEYGLTQSQSDTSL